MAQAHWLRLIGTHGPSSSEPSPVHAFCLYAHTPSCPISTSSIPASLSKCLRKLLLFPHKRARYSLHRILNHQTWLVHLHIAPPPRLGKHVKAIKTEAGLSHSSVLGAPGGPSEPTGCWIMGRSQGRDRGIGAAGGTQAIVVNLAPPIFPDLGLYAPTLSCL